MGRKQNMSKGRKVRSATVIHALLVVLEIIALIHDIWVFGPGMFQYYTINSNVLQLVVSVCILACLLRGKRTSCCLKVLHLVCAVCLTVTFLIAALVLAPQEGFAYYFLSDVAPINHFLGPVLSVISFILTQNEEPLPKPAVFAPAAASLLYGVIALVLNAVRMLDGPYFFLRVHEEAASTIVMWFLIIAFLCLILSALYMWLRHIAGRNQRKA